MAIARTKSDNLVETKVVEKKESSLQIPPSNDSKSTITNTKSVSKKPGFIKTTIEELRKVSWPSFSHVIRWSLVIILFTALISLLLGFFDYTFESGIRYVYCTSPKGLQRSAQDCNREFLENITFQR